VRRTVVVVIALATAGLVAFLVRRSNDDPQPPPQTVVRVEAPDELCWDAQLSIPGLQGGSGVAQVTHDGCGHDTFDLGLGAGGSATVTRTAGPGLLAAVILSDGKEVARQTTAPGTDSVTVAYPKN
jgi:hypothetical protein